MYIETWYEAEYFLIDFLIFVFIFYKYIKKYIYTVAKLMKKYTLLILLSINTLQKYSDRTNEK